VKKYGGRAAVRVLCVAMTSPLVPDGRERAVDAADDVEAAYISAGDCRAAVHRRLTAKPGKRHTARRSAWRVQPWLRSKPAATVASTTHGADSAGFPTFGQPEGRYRDTVIRTVTDVPVVGHPLRLRVRVPRYRCPPS